MSAHAWTLNAVRSDGVLFADRWRAPLLRRHPINCTDADSWAFSGNIAACEGINLKELAQGK